MSARQAAPIYFISTLIKRKLIATSLIMLQAAFDDVNGKTQGKKRRCKGSGGVYARPGCSGGNTLVSNDENKQALSPLLSLSLFLSLSPQSHFVKIVKDVATL